MLLPCLCGAQGCGLSYLVLENMQVKAKGDDLYSNATPEQYLEAFTTADQQIPWDRAGIYQLHSYQRKPRPLYSSQENEDKGEGITP